MTTEEKIEFLDQYATHKAHLDFYKKRKGVVADMISTITHFKVPVDDNRVDKLRKTKDDYDKLIEEASNEMEKVENAINACPDFTLRRVMLLRVVEGMQWEEIAALMHATKATGIRRYRRGAEKLDI